MNKLLVAVFDNETAAENGLNALRALHTAGDISLYATSVVEREANGLMTVKKPMDAGAVGTATGLAVGSLIGLLGGPIGLAIGAVTGTVVGAIRDFWVAGVGLDFIEEISKHMQPSKVALVAEIEEEWVIPVDTAMETLGGEVFRRNRTEVAEAQFDHDIVAFKSEVKELESEASNTSGAATAKLQAKLDAAKLGLEGAVQRAKQRVDALKTEAEIKTDSLERQLSQTTGDMKAKIEDRLKRVERAYHARGAKLSQAWNLTKEALSA